MVVQLLIETKILFLFKYYQIFAHPQRITHPPMNPIIVLNLVHLHGLLEVYHKQFKVLLGYKPPRMYGVD
jgi:hypothetical protein